MRFKYLNIKDLNMRYEMSPPSWATVPTVTLMIKKTVTEG